MVRIAAKWSEYLSPRIGARTCSFARVATGTNSQFVFVKRLPSPPLANKLALIFVAADASLSLDSAPKNR
jgi:hypothetical protein